MMAAGKTTPPGDGRDARQDGPAGARPADGDPITEAHRAWRDGAYRAALGEVGERRDFVTDIGIAVEPLYTPHSLADRRFDYLKDVGFPGAFPFTRGDDPAMYRRAPFIVSAYTGFGEAPACNRRLKRLVELGVEQLLLAFDLPTQCGYDSDDVMAAGEVGRVGVAIDTLADMEDLFEDLPLDTVKRVGCLGNAIGPIVTAMFVALAEKQGLAPADFVLNLQNDPLKEYLARGTQILPVAPSLKLAADPVSWCVTHAPHWSPLTVCYNHLNAGGAGSSMGAAIALANARAYLDDLLARGHSIDEVAPLLHMFADERHDFFVSVANMRALRKVWAHLMRDAYGATTDRAMALATTVYGHGQEALAEPINNLVRIAFGTLAYVMGGASYVYIASYDEAVGIPSEETVRAAVRTQQIIAHEHGFTDTIDPLGGSWLVESLTIDIERQLRDGLSAIEAMGGALAIIDNGYGRKLMSEGAGRRQKRIDTGARPWVTVNLHRQEPNVPNTAFRIDPATGDRQIARLAAVKARRDGARVAAALAEIDRACAEGRNVMEPTLEAVRAYASIGEIVDVWRRRYGEFQPSTAF
ncbi:MAG: methylmalonyl-CoA mutase family protein [Hyphomicrobiaceae bacterium]